MSAQLTPSCSNSNSSDPKKRAVNFTANEKMLLLNLVAQFKHIIENKKTDGATWRLKDETWEKVTRLFNSQSFDNISKNKASIRKYYENLKKNLRKDVVEEKKSIRCTGGGPPKKPRKNEDHQELLLSLVGEKTVYGLNNPYDGDCREDSNHYNNNNALNKDIDEVDFITIEHAEHSYATNKAIFDEEIIVQDNLNEECNKTPKNPTNILRTKKDDSLDHRWTSRRTPRKASLNQGNNLKEEYSELAKVKVELYNEELKLARQRNEREQEIHDLTKESLMLEIRKNILEMKRLEDML